jgi:hypothetical protein
MGFYIDTSKLKWIFWKSHHSVLLIDMLLEGERLFHSQMWVKGTPLHFIVDSRKPEKPHLSKGHQAVGIVENTTPVTIQHRWLW